jgi:mycofactocin system glycosyltransferase
MVGSPQESSTATTKLSDTDLIAEKNTEHCGSSKPLAYRLRDSVHYFQGNGSPFLVLDFPLKSIVLHPFWRPLFESLSSHGFMTFEKILSRVNHDDPIKIEIFLNGLVRKGFLEQDGCLTPQQYPSVTVIIPVRNRPREIAACLQSLGRLEYPKNKIEIIVIDDASDDSTPDVVSTFPVQLIPLKERRQASFCRNLGAQKAQGDILAFLDSDCIADPLWIKELVPAFNDPSNGAVGGTVDAYYTKKGLDCYEKIKSSLYMGSWAKSSHEMNPFFYLPSCNLLVRKNLLLQLKGFREDMHVGEDVDFCWRLQDEGHCIEYRPVGTVYHRHRNTIRDFCARRFDYGTSEPLLQQSHAKRIKQFLFPISDATFWGLVFLSIISGWLPLLGLGGLVLLTDSLVKCTRVRRKNIPISFIYILLASFRGYLAFAYHCCAFVSRYYLLWAPLVCVAAPVGGAIIFGAHLLTGIVDYFIKKPRLRLPSFLLYFTLDQLSYQLGVWWGCLKRFCFSPVNPQIVRKSLHNV